MAGKTKITPADIMFQETLEVEKALIPVREQKRIAEQAEIREEVLRCMQEAKESGSREVIFLNQGMRVNGRKTIHTNMVSSELIDELRKDGFVVTRDTQLPYFDHLTISWDKTKQEEKQPDEKPVEKPQGFWSRAKAKIVGKSDDKSDKER